MRTSILPIQATRTLRVPLGGILIMRVAFRIWANGPSRSIDRSNVRSPVLHQGQRHFRSDINFVYQTTPVEFAQTCFLTLTEIKEKMFAIIFSAELR